MSAVGQGATVGHRDRISLDVQIAQRIERVVERDVAAAHRCAVGAIGVQRGGTRCPGARAIGDGVFARRLFGRNHHAGPSLRAAQQLQVTQHVVAIVQRNSVATLGFKVGCTIRGPGARALGDAADRVVFPDIDGAKVAVDIAIAILGDGQATKDVVLAAQFNGLAIGGDQRNRSRTQGPGRGLGNSVVFRDVDR